MLYIRRDATTTNSKSLVLAGPENDPTLRVYSDWTRRRQFDGVNHDALVFEHMLFNRTIHTGRTAL